MRATARFRRGHLAWVIPYQARFGRWNTETYITDCLLMFLAGASGGGILVFFLKRQATVAQRWAVLIAFLLASPVAPLMMIMGCSGRGNFGSVAVVPRLAGGRHLSGRLHDGEG